MLDIKIWFRLVFVASAVAILPFGRVQSAFAGNTLTAAQWREDLHYLTDQIQKVHPRPFHHISRLEFETQVSQVNVAIPTLSDHEIELEFARIVALLGEGHSRISLPGLPDPMSDVPEVTPFKQESLAFHRIPVRLYSFADGLFIVAATAQYRSLIGAQVLQIGDRSAQSALDAVKSLVNRDNEMGARLISPDLVVVPEILQAEHIINDRGNIQLTLRQIDGTEGRVNLTPLPTENEPIWSVPSDNAHAAPPPFLRPSGQNFSLEYLPPSQTLVAHVFVIKDTPTESVAAFAREISNFARVQTVDKFVIDFRDCHGGDNQRFRPILLELIRNRVINQPGKSFALINRATFSAAVNASSDLERLSNFIFVGEPTAGSPSSWGDPRSITLPNSGLIARISSVYWRDWTADESRPSIEPDLSVPISSRDFFAARDSQFSAIQDFPKSAEITDVLVNLVRAGAGVRTIVRFYYQHKTDATWATESTQAAMQRVGAEFLSKKSYDDALLVFQINFRDYPTSLLDEINVVHRALSVDPTNPELANLAKKLDEMQRSPPH